MPRDDDDDDDAFCVVLDARGRVHGAAIDGDEGAYFATRARDAFARTAAHRARLADSCRKIDALGTLWLGARDAPRCALERFVKSVYDAHARGVTRDDARSGVEFWARTRATAAHWDKDERAREIAGVCVTPHVSTVTYVEVEESARVAPTVVFEGLTARGRPDAETRDEAGARCERAAVMIPKAGAHFKFDGRFLHGVFDEFASGDVDASAARVTLLANIWFDHVPVGVERLDESLAATLGDDESCVANEAATEMTTRTIASSEFATTPMKDVAFGPSGGEYELVGAEFPFDELRESAKGEEGEERVHLFFITNEAGVRIKLRDDDEPASKRVKM